VGNIVQVLGTQSHQTATQARTTLILEGQIAHFVQLGTFVQAGAELRLKYALQALFAPTLG
jgi:hypothetical protein